MEITGVELDWDKSKSEPQVSPSSVPSPAYLLARRFTFGLIRTISSADTNSDINPITLLKIPTILYYADPPTFSGISSFTNGLDIDVNFEDCSVNMPSTSFHFFSLSEVCPEIPPLTTQNETDCLRLSQALIQSVLAVNSAFNNGQCNSSAVPFFCNATYSLCGDDTYMMDISEECVQVRDGDCPIEWRVLENFFNVPIPDCGSFSENGDLTFSKAPPLNCSDQFDVFCGSVCLPVCSEFSQMSQGFTVMSNVLTILFEIIGIISGFVTLIACVFKHKTMFLFPQIYIVYNTVNVILILIFLILPLLFGYSKFLCSDRNLLEALKSPTEYCQAQGFILHAGILYFVGIWLFHLSHLLFALAFPIKAKKFMQDHSTACHITEVIIVLVLGSLPGAVIAGTSKYQVNTFPPEFCVPASLSAFFHSFELPVAIGATVGLSMSFTAFWILRRNHQLKTARLEEESSPKSRTFLTVLKSFCTGFSSTPETKLFFLFWYYILVAVVLYAYFTVVLQRASTRADHLYEYFSCSTAGYKPECEVYKKNLNDVTLAGYVLDLVSTMLLCSVTLSNLVYVLQYIEVKKFLLKLFTVH